MPKRSAGLLLYRRPGHQIEVFLVHPGGPFWAKKDEGAWSIPKGEHPEEEDPLAAAKREFYEETGFSPSGHFIELGEVKQPSGKRLRVWAVEGDCDPGQLKSNAFRLEWPPRSGHQIQVPEADRGAWFSIAAGKVHLLRGQIPFLEMLVEHLKR
ncbi:MAG TPA: NUDIX domain-containing protein [Bryobacteraceae bacterium]|jgi:predicted NUDIX family NTP pyrophosphohydrolase